MKKQINWNIPEKELNLVFKIVNRNCKNDLLFSDRLNLEKDLITTPLNGCPLDFGRLLSFDEFNFAHDIAVIQRNIDRKTGSLKNCFLSRCSRRV